MLIFESPYPQLGKSSITFVLPEIVFSSKYMKLFPDCCVIFFYFRPKSRPFLEKEDFLRKKKTLFAQFFQKGLLSRPRSTKVDPVGITGVLINPPGANLKLWLE